MERRLMEHLSCWLGGRPVTSGLDIVGTPRRSSPGWDGRIHPVLGVASPEGGVLSVPVEHAATVVEQYAKDNDLTALGPRIPGLVGFPERGWFTAVYRWTT